MPARTNAFQTLVRLIQGELAPHGYSVTESKLLLDRRDGKEREVDVVLEGSAGPHRITISVEATKGTRKATVEWVEQMYAKHEHLPTNKLVLVSRGGFTRNALKEAALRGADALTIKEASRRDWRICINLETIEFNHRRIYPTDFMINATPYGDKPFLSGHIRDLTVHFEGGARKVPLVDVVQAALADQNVQADLTSDTTGPDVWTCKVSLELREGTLLVDAHNGVAQVTSLSFMARYKQWQASIPLEYSHIGDLRLAHGTAKTSAGEIVALICEPEGDTAVIKLAIVPGTQTGAGVLQLTKKPQSAGA